MNSTDSGHKIRVRIAEFKVAKGDAVLVAVGLGSCVGVAVYDPQREVGGMAHILLPGSGKENDNPYKFSDSSIEAMVNQIIKMGGAREALQAKIVGGANMFSWLGDRKKSIGERNVKSAKEKLASLSIPVVSEETGGSEGRSVEFHAGSGKLIIRNALGVEHSI